VGRIRLCDIMKNTYLVREHAEIFLRRLEAERGISGFFFELNLASSYLAPKKAAITPFQALHQTENLIYCVALFCVVDNNMLL
jgi:hypothetical protein